MLQKMGKNTPDMGKHTSDTCQTWVRIGRIWHLPNTNFSGRTTAAEELATTFPAWFDRNEWYV